MNADLISQRGSGCRTFLWKVFPPFSEFIPKLLEKEPRNSEQNVNFRGELEVYSAFNMIQSMSESESLLLPSRFSHTSNFSGVFGANLNIENIGKVERTYLQ